MIDVASIVPFDNPPDLLTWPATSAITLVNLAREGVQVVFDKQDGPDRWPDVPFGKPGDSLQYTLGLVRLIFGQPAASCAIQYWFGLSRNGGPVLEGNQIAVNWYYDARWGPLQAWQPVDGEHVGLLCAAGNLRGVHDGSQSPVKERTNVVEFVWPAAYGTVPLLWMEPTVAPPPPPPPPPPDVPHLLAAHFDTVASEFSMIARLLRVL